jgi:hypothetical protein
MQDELSGKREISRESSRTETASNGFDRIKLLRCKGDLPSLFLAKENELSLSWLLFFQHLENLIVVKVIREGLVDVLNQVFSTKVISTDYRYY